MMTQMVMSRGVPHSLPDTPPSLRYGKGYFSSDNEDVMVMDTKLKIIEILQVSAPCRTNTFESCDVSCECLTWFLVAFCSPVSSFWAWGWITGSLTCCPSTRKSLETIVWQKAPPWQRCPQFLVRIFSSFMQTQAHLKKKKNILS